MNDPLSGSACATTHTSTTLLNALKDRNDGAAWTLFVQRYRQPILRFARTQGLSTEDSEDAAQCALAAFARAYQDGRYERARGRLRDWLFGIVRVEVRNWRRKCARHLPDVANQKHREETIDQAEEAAWEQEWGHAVLQHVLAAVRGEVQASTFAAFELFALQGLPAHEVAQRLGISVNAVFGAKRRVLSRLRELVPAMEQTW